MQNIGHVIPQLIALILFNVIMAGGILIVSGAQSLKDTTRKAIITLLYAVIIGGSGLLVFATIYALYFVHY